MRIETDKIYCGDSLQVLQTLPENAVDCCVTSPPYYALRDYGADGQIGREATPEEYVSRITAVFHEVKRVLTPEGTCWLNIADTYCGTGSKADHQDPKYPKGERIWVGYYNAEHELCFILTSKESREFYFLYELVDGEFKKLGKARTPKELEDKFEVSKRMRCAQ